MLGNLHVRFGRRLLATKSRFFFSDGSGFLSHAEGRRFESSRPDQQFKDLREPARGRLFRGRGLSASCCRSARLAAAGQRRVRAAAALGGAPMSGQEPGRQTVSLLQFARDGPFRRRFVAHSAHYGLLTAAELSSPLANFATAPSAVHAPRHRSSASAGAGRRPWRRGAIHARRCGVVSQREAGLSTSGQKPAARAAGPPLRSRRPAPSTQAFPRQGSRRFEATRVICPKILCTFLFIFLFMPCLLHELSC